MSEGLCLKFVKDLVDNGVQTSDSVLVVDSTPNLCLHLKEAGFTNLTYSYNGQAGSGTRWVHNIKGFCSTQKIQTVAFDSKNPPMKKFDAVIGNPPFQSLDHNSKTNNVWSKFLAWSFENSDYVSLVLPGSALAPSTFSKYKEFVTEVDLDVKKHFPGVGSTFCTLTLDRNTKSRFITVNNSGGSFKVRRSSTDFISLSHSKELEAQIQDFLSGGREWLMGYEYECRKKIFCENGKYEVRHTQRNGVWKTDVYHPNNDLLRVSIDLSGQPRFRVTENMGLTNAHIWTVFETREEAQEYADWGNSDETQEFLSKVKWGGMQLFRIIKRLK